MWAAHGKYWRKKTYPKRIIKTDIENYSRKYIEDYEPETIGESWISIKNI